MRRALNVPVMAHPEFAGAAIDRGLADGESIAVGRHRLRVRHPRPYADQMCIAVMSDDHIIVGDTLFDGGPGKTWTPEVSNHPGHSSTGNPRLAG